MGGNDSGEKTEEPTPRKKQEARKQGIVTKSMDLTGALTMLAMMASLPAIMQTFGTGMMESMQFSLRNMPMTLHHGDMTAWIINLAKPAVLAAAMVMGIAMLSGVVLNVAQTGFHASTEAIKPKFEKIDPIKGFKRIFGARAMMEGLKATAKGLIFGWIAYAAIRDYQPQLVRLSYLSPSEAASVIGGLMSTIGMRIAGTWLAIGMLDFFFQKKQTNKQLMMTKDELKREMKEQEGSPEIKHARMQRARQLVKGRMAESVRKADVIITNPTHFSVAIQYDRSKMHAPMVVAKGQDYLALKIREIAAASDVPIVPAPPLARALYKQCEIGDFVPRDQFTAVAEVLAFIYRTAKKMR
jgi:flagellar biosynthesis protein FlhB